MVIAAAYRVRQILVWIVLADGTAIHKLLLFLVNPCFSPYQFHPIPGILFICGLQVVVLGGGEQTEDMFAAAFGVFEVGYGCEVGEVDLLVEALFGGVFVDGKEVGAEDEIEFLPLLWAQGSVYIKLVANT